MLFGGPLTLLQVLHLSGQRSVVEKHARYAFVHPFAEVFSSIICSIPAEICKTIVFSAILYFMTNLRRTSLAFFTFTAFSFVITMTLSMLFRTVGACCRTVAQTLCSNGILILVLMMYTGFVIPQIGMNSWLAWIYYINPAGYAYESLIINEFYGHVFPCANLVPTGPSYIGISPHNRVCSVVGSIGGFEDVLGTIYLELEFGFQPIHLWRYVMI